MRRYSSGFSLLEILVAFSILSIGLGVLLQIFSTSLMSAERIRDEQSLYAQARTLLAAIEGEPSLTPGTRNGVLPGVCEWTVSVTPQDNPFAVGVPPGQIGLWRLEANVSTLTTPRRAVKLQTLYVKPTSSQ